MELGMVGSGKMGGNMVRRIFRDSEHEVVVFDQKSRAVADMEAIGATGANSLSDLVSKLEAPRHVWIMVPAGVATQETVDALAELLEPGDTIVDGGNSQWTDDRSRQEALRERDIHYVDVGTSGGIWGLEKGYCMMVGGDEEAVSQLAPIFDVLALPFSEEHGPGWRRVGPTGAGHFVKMVHNAIEYGMMAAIAEGFAVFTACDEFSLDLAAIARLWMQHSINAGALMEFTAITLEREGNGLAALEPHVDDSGEGLWTILYALGKKIPVPVITLALYDRFASRGLANFGRKLLAGLRNTFGGHTALRKE